MGADTAALLSEGHVSFHKNKNWKEKPVGMSPACYRSDLKMSPKGPCSGPQSGARGRCRSFTRQGPVCHGTPTPLPRVTQNCVKRMEQPPQTFAW